ncbi:MAG: GNAT family N-acetyltransferase, partial [Acidobacteria bacterium]|nr:GNAT family N-acetyltransferase [Acidobacteriota bacterium]
GLALAEVALAGAGDAELLSLFVAPEERRQGLGRLLTARVSEELAREGAATVRAVWTSGRPAIGYLERILAAERWSPPTARTVSVRFRPEEMLTLSLFSPRHLAALDSGLEFESWAEVSQEELAALRASNEAKPWITPGLEPWSYDEKIPYDAATSVAARLRGELVGWVLTQRIDARLLRWTVSFLDRRLSRRGRIVPVYQQSLERAVAAGYEFCVFVTPVRYPNMLRFIDRWISQRAAFVGETRGARRGLVVP